MDPELSATDYMRQAKYTTADYMYYAEKEMGIKDIALQIEFAKACAMDFNSMFVGMKVQYIGEMVSNLGNQIQEILINS